MNAREAQLFARALADEFLLTTEGESVLANLQVIRRHAHSGAIPSPEMHRDFAMLVWRALEVCEKDEGDPPDTPLPSVARLNRDTYEGDGHASIWVPGEEFDP